MPRSPSGAPHQGRSVHLTMPRPLSVSSSLAEPLSPVSPGLASQLPINQRGSWHSASYNSHRESYQSARSFTYSEYGQVQFVTSPGVMGSGQTLPAPVTLGARRQPSLNSLGSPPPDTDGASAIDPVRERQVHGIV